MFLDYPIHVWASVILAVFVRLTNDTKGSATIPRRVLIGKKLTNAITSTASGMILHKPIVEILEISDKWYVIVAILVALTAENIMRSIIHVSEDDEAVTGIIKRYLPIQKKTNGGSE